MQIKGFQVPSRWRRSAREQSVNHDGFQHDYAGLQNRTPEKRRPASSATPLESTYHGAASPWRPPYLQTKVLGAFLLLFVALIISLQALLAVSDRKRGLATSYPGLQYVWKYGPTAILTLVAAFWVRVECQTKIVAPWLNMAQGPSMAQSSVLLDYLAMFHPFSLLEAIQNKDWAVAAATGITTIIRLLVIISTALIVLTPTDVLYPEAPMMLESVFVDNPAGLKDRAPLASYTFEGLVRLNTSIPDGIHSEFAHQLVGTQLAGSTVFTTTVDGFSAGLSCETAKITLTDVGRPQHGTYMNRVVANLNSTGCNLSLTFIGPAVNKAYGVHKPFARFMQGGCGGSVDVKDQRVAVLYAVMNYTQGAFVEHTNYDGDVYNITGELLRSNTMICTPTYSIRDIELTRNATQTQSLVVTDSAPRQLQNVVAWDITKALFYSFENALQDFSWNHALNVSDTPVDVDPYTDLALGLVNSTISMPTLDSLYEEEGARQFVNNFYQRYAAVLAHGSLMRSASVESTGSAWVTEERLIVRSVPVHLMSGLLVLSIALLFTVWRTMPKDPILPRNPSTIIGMAALVAQSYPFVRNFEGMGASSRASLASLLECWDYRAGNGVGEDPVGSFGIRTNQLLPTNDDLELRGVEQHRAHPRSLNPMVRIPIHILLLAAIIVLEMTLRISQRGDGLGDVWNESQTQYIWTICPAIALSSVALHFVAVDYDLRSLAPYAHLSRGAGFQSSVGLDLVNRFTLPTILKEIRTGSYAAFAGTVTMALASVLTIFSASLFYATSVPTTYTAVLDTSSSVWLDNYAIAANRGEGELSASLILASNLSYPAFTYQDLVLPELKVQANTEADAGNWDSLNSSTIVINATLPAVRSRFVCRLYDSSQIRTNFTLGSNYSYSISNPLRIDIKQEECYVTPNTTSRASNLILSTGPSTPERSYFGVGSYARNGLELEGCSDFLWIWGNWTLQSGTDGKPTTAVSALGCNETYGTVDVEATFHGADLRIDPSQPPIPDERSAVNNVTVPDSFSTYFQLAPLTSATDNFDTFFTLLTTSRYAAPIQDLGDPARASSIADAIRLQHGVLRAQRINSRNRGPKTEKKQTGFFAGTDDSLEHNATVSDTVSRRRVVQDAASTRIIEALLAATLLCSAATWVLMRNTDVLPRAPTSIANVVALLADGNLFDFLPAHVESAPVADLARGFGHNAVFRLGWRLVPGHSEQRYMIYVETDPLAASKYRHSDSEAEAFVPGPRIAPPPIWIETPTATRAAPGAEEHSGMIGKGEESPRPVSALDAPPSREGHVSMLSEWDGSKPESMDDVAISPLSPSQPSHHWGKDVDPAPSWR